MTNRIDLERFRSTQEHVYPQVIAELKAGRKQGHWIWFIFPQLEGLGLSEMNARYAIRSLEEARAYLADTVLYDRLAECCDLLLAHSSQSIDRIMGYPDNLKLRSSMTLFELADPDDPIFTEVLDTFYQGARDSVTWELLGYSG